MQAMCSEHGGMGEIVWCDEHRQFCARCWQRLETTTQVAREAAVARRRVIQLPGNAVVRLTGEIPRVVVVRGVQYAVDKPNLNNSAKGKE